MIEAAILIGALALADATNAQPARAQNCKARVSRPIVDDLGNHWNPGTILPVDIERNGIPGGSLCAHGGSCIPVRSHGGTALTLVNCEVGPSLGLGDRLLVADPKLVGSASAAAWFRRYHAERKLGGLGFSDASAATLADDLVNDPRSSTSERVASALAGSTTAIAALKRSNP